MSAGLGLIGVAAEGPADGVGRIAIVVEHEVGMAVAGEPALDAVVVLREGAAYGAFGGVAIGPSGSGGDFVFMAEALAELIVGAADVLTERVPAGGFVPGEVVGREDSHIGANRHPPGRRIAGRGVAGPWDLAGDRQREQGASSNDSPKSDGSDGCFHEKCWFRRTLAAAVDPRGGTRSTTVESLRRRGGSGKVRWGPRRLPPGGTISASKGRWVLSRRERGSIWQGPGACAQRLRTSRKRRCGRRCVRRGWCGVRRCRRPLRSPS